jgi:uncharacterized protein (DUF1501 family)
MLLRGDAPVLSHAAGGLEVGNEALLARLEVLWREDALLHLLLDAALAARDLAGDMAGEREGRSAGQRRVTDGSRLAAVAARFLTSEGGPRIAAFGLDGFDTHAQQKGRMTALLGGLDRTLAALRTGLGPVWGETLVVAATEFGRTAAANGTGGTDHGTGAALLLAGGSIPGQRRAVLGDWPGLTAPKLLDGRDLRPTADLRAAIGGVVAGHFGLEPDQVMAALFPSAVGLRAHPALV